MTGRARYNVVVPTQYGAMIVNRNDEVAVAGYGSFGVGYELMVNGTYQPDELDMIGQLLTACPPNPVVLDVGANIGVHSLFLSKRVGDSGRVIAFEPQRIIYQMLLGNLALNSIENVWTHNAAVGAREGWLAFTCPDYTQSTNFGGIALPKGQIGAAPELPTKPDAPRETEQVHVITIDSLKLESVDFIKLDVEEMELDALLGASITLDRCRPLMQIEWLGRDGGALPLYLRDELDYKVYVHNMNLLCIPTERTESIMVQCPVWDIRSLENTEQGS